MSTLAEKLDQERSSSLTSRARCKLSFLQGRSGYRVEQEDKKGPILVSVCPMETRYYWRLVRADGKKDAIMELEREERNG